MIDPHKLYNAIDHTITDEMHWDVYLMGPIFGRPHLNLGEFVPVKKYLERYLGLTVLVPQQIPPHPHEGHCPEGFRHSEGSQHPECCYARADLIWMLRNCNGCYVLPGWQPSVGSRLELLVASQTGMPIQFITKKQLQDIKFSPDRGALLELPDGLLPKFLRDKLNSKLKGNS